MQSLLTCEPPPTVCCVLHFDLVIALGEQAVAYKKGNVAGVMPYRLGCSFDRYLQNTTCWEGHVRSNTCIAFEGWAGGKPCFCHLESKGKWGTEIFGGVLKQVMLAQAQKTCCLGATDFTVVRLPDCDSKRSLRITRELT